MNKFLIHRVLVFILFMGFLANQAFADEIYERKGYKLTINNQSEGLDGDVLNSLVETFFTVYPVLCRNYNLNAVKEVEFFIDPKYNGVAEAGGGRVRINPQWLKDHPYDFDMITHEVMHLVQAYPNGAGPWWVTEGIADYMRYMYGCDNEKGGWEMPTYQDKQNYDNSYRITARFFVWIEREKKPGFIKLLDHTMRTDTYNNKVWKSNLGKSIEDLWEEYSKNPSI